MDRRARTRQAHELSAQGVSLTAIGRRLGVSARTIKRDLETAPELDAVQVESLRAELIAEARQVMAAWRSRAIGEGDRKPSATAARVVLDAVKIAASVGGLHRVDPDRAAPPGFEINVTYTRPPADHVDLVLGDPLDAARDVTPAEPS